MKRDRLPALANTVGLAVGLCFAVVAGLSASAAEPPKGLVLHFSFDQAEPGARIVDRSGQNNSGRASGVPWTPSGKQGGGCEFTGAGSQIRVANSPSLTLNQATYAVWFKASRPGAIGRRIFDKGGDKGFGLGIGGGGKDGQARGRVTATIGGGPTCSSDAPVADGAWHHAAATFDGENLRLYVDGQPQSQVVPVRTRIAANAADLILGMSRSNALPREKGPSFEGAIDEVMIFNRALAANEVNALVAAVDPLAAKRKFTKQQVAARLRQLKILFEEGLLTEDFYERKVKECESLR